jgi:sugar phosphate isomerase/epimerase
MGPLPLAAFEEDSMKRRTFLTTVAAAGLLPHVTVRSAAAQAPAPKRELLKLGVASYSLRKFPFEKALEMAKACDVKYINFKDVHLARTAPPEVIKDARAKTEAAGFTILGGGTIDMKKPDEAAIRKDFEYAKLAGMPLIVSAPSLESLDIVEKLAKEFQIKIGIHNHGPEDKIFPSPYDAYKAIKARDKMMGLCVDIGHTWRAGVDPTKAVVELRDRVYDLHVKDLANLKERDSQVIVGKGAMDVPALFRALIKINFQGHVGLEYEINENDPLPGMLQSFAYMRGVLAGIQST